METGLGDVHAAALAALAAVAPPRAAALTESVTIDLDTTDVEVYGRHKRGVAYNHQGQRVGRPHVATWADTATVLAADLLAGNEDPRRDAPELLRRALAALPAAARAGRIRLRADAGYFAGQLARAALFADIEFAIGARRIAPLWRLLDGLAEADWTDAIDMPGAQVAVADYCPNWWPAATRLLIRRVRLDVTRRSSVSADPRARRRRTLHPDQRALPLAELADLDAVYGYSFIVTNLDVSTGERGRRGRALVPAPHPGREPVPRRQARRRAAPPALRISRGQPGLDVGRAARGQPHRLAAPAHRHPAARRQPARARRPRRPGHDRHPAAPADPRPRPTRPSRRHAHPAPTTRVTTCSPRSSPASAPCPRRPDPADPAPNPLRNHATRGDTRALALPALPKQRSQKITFLRSRSSDCYSRIRVL